MKKIIVLLMTVFFLSSFGIVAQERTLAKNVKITTVQDDSSEDPDNLATEYFSQIMGVALSSNSNLNLYQFIYDWIGTPYRLGGKSKKGVDCSGFVGEIYGKVFNAIIGDNSRKMFNMVSPISRQELKVGDLVFFKIRSRAITHVGIYIGDDKFAHASSSRGVRISNLEEPYCKRYYFRGGRLPDDAKRQLETQLD